MADNRHVDVDLDDVPTKTAHTPRVSDVHEVCF